MNKTTTKKTSKKQAKEKPTVDSKSILGSYLKDNKEHHYNFEESFDYKVSSGSLLFDLQLGGGFGPGLHRFCGINEGGKTSASLAVMKNFLETVPKAKGVYVKAEGRLSPEMQARVGITFVFSADEWAEGTCFVLESNIYETAVDIMRELVGNNPEGNHYCFVLDSVDSLIAKCDLEKDLEDAPKVAGGAVIAATLMKKIAIALQKRGHMAIFISQVRAHISLGQSNEPIRQTTATGGHALLHFANWIIEFEPRFIMGKKSDDAIRKNQSADFNAKTNPNIGHFAKARIKKSPNETTGRLASYPICYGRTGGRSIWIEKEICDLLFAWEYLKKKTSWISPTEDFIALMEEQQLDWPSNLQGEQAVFDYIEDNKDVRDFLVSHFKTIINGE